MARISTDTARIAVIAADPNSVLSDKGRVA